MKPSPLWRNRDYVAWLAADTANQFGGAIRSFAMTLIAYAVTGSFAQAGAVATTSAVVSLAAGLPGGLVVDRWDRRRSLYLSGALRALIYGAAAVCWWTGTLTFPILLAIALGSGTVGGMFGTATDAALKSVVPGVDLPRAVAANQGRDAAVSLASSPLSGLLMAVSNALPFAAGAVGALLQVLGTRLIRADLRPHRSDSARKPILRELLAGFEFLLRNPMLRRLLPALVLLNCGMGALFVGVTLILRGQGVPAWRIGLIDTVFAVGMLAGSVVASKLIAAVPTGRLTTWLFLAITAALLPVSLTQALPVVFVSFALVGACAPAINGALVGYLQALLPDDVQGRGLGALGLLNSSIPSLMPAAVGLGLEHVGASPTMLATIVLFPAAAAVLLSNRELRALPTPDLWELGDTVKA